MVQGRRARRWPGGSAAVEQLEIEREMAESRARQVRIRQAVIDEQTEVINRQTQALSRGLWFSRDGC